MKYILRTLIIVFLALGATGVSAYSLTDPINTQYTPLVPIQGVTDGASTVGDIGTYIQRSYVLVILSNIADREGLAYSPDKSGTIPAVVKEEGIAFYIAKGSDR